MRYKIRTLAPVNIGNGDEITPYEYVIDDGKLCRVNIDSLFRDPDFDSEKFISESSRRNFNLEHFNKEASLRNIEYSAEIAEGVQNTLSIGLRSGWGNVRELIKTRGYPYIPGSSLKGSIRTALADHILCNDPMTSLKVKRTVIDQRKWSRDKKRADDSIMEIVYGEDPTHDLLRGLQVSDTSLDKDYRLQIGAVKILTTTSPYTHLWKRFPRSNVSLGEASTIFIESFKTGISLEGELKMDEWLLKGEGGDIPSSLGFENGPSFLEDLPEVARERCLKYIEGELEFYRTYNQPSDLDGIIDWYEELKAEIDGMRDHVFPLQVGWGVGWKNMTVSNYIKNEDILWEIKNRYQLGKKRIPEFPKTRRIWIEDERPTYPMGWIEVSLEPE